MSKLLKASRLVYSTARSFFIPTVVQLAMQPLERCDVGCPYCKRDWNAEEAMTLKDIALIVRKVKELHVGYINITGGEPLIWKHIIEAISILSQRQVGTFMSTSGFSLDEDMVHGLGLAGLNGCNLSLDGLTDLETSRKTLSQHDSEFLDRFIELRERYGVKLGVNSVLCQENLDQIMPLLEFAEKHGFTISFSYLVPEIKPGSGSGLVLPQIPANVYDAIRLAEKKGTIFGQLEYLLSPTFDCFNAKKTAICVTPKMLLTYCYLTGGMSPYCLEDLDKDTLVKHLEGLERYVTGCNQFCTSHCAYMSDYAKSHPLRVLMQAWKTLLRD